MRRILAIFLTLLFILVSSVGFRYDAAQDEDIKAAVNKYFDLKYRSLSKLSFDNRIMDMIPPETLASRDVINEADVIDTLIKYRKAQINDLTFDRYKYSLYFQSISVNEGIARVSFNEQFELYFKCAPTVKNSSTIQHVITLKYVNGKWLILSDDYSDAEGIKKKLNKYFIEDGLSIADAKARVLVELNNQANARINRLNEILKGLKDKNLMVFYIGKNVAYINGAGQKIDSKANITPVSVNNVPYLPLSYIASRFGYSMKPGSNGNTISLSAKGHTIVAKTGNSYITMDGKKIILGAVLITYKGTLMFPAKAVTSTFGRKLFISGNLLILSDNVFDSRKNAAIIKSLAEYFSVMFTKMDFPRIDGSTATYPLSIEIGKLLLGLDDTSAKGFITHKTTHNAYVNLINKSADIIFVTQPSPEELKLAKDKGVQLEVIPVCKEGFVFLVNKENTVDNLTSTQIRDIYQGKINNWKEVNGEDNSIIPYQREANSGSQTLMENLVMKGYKLMQPPKEVVIYGMGELIDKVAGYSNAKNALGYSVYYYATQMYQTGNIKLLSIDGVMPGNITIKSGKYPFTTSYYAVVRKDEPRDSSARRLLNWILGSEGQDIVEKSGFVKVK